MTWISIRFTKPEVLKLMSAHNLSSLKWSAEGELSPQDTWNLVRKLTKTEDVSKASYLLHLSSKHTHGKSNKVKNGL